MKHIFFCLLGMLIFRAEAQTSLLNVVEGLSGMNQAARGPDVICNTCEANSDLSPRAAIEKIFDGKLTFLGRDLFPGADQNRSCVYKSDTAYILYHNCMSSKKEAPATSIDIIDFNGGITNFYIENAQQGPISQMQRQDYSMTWTVSYKRSPAPGNIGIAALKSYIERHKNGYDPRGGCYIGESFKAKDTSQAAKCYGTTKDSPIAQQWSGLAENFWRDPGSRWYEALKHLRKTVVGTSF
jgi:hypothetical protein